MQNYNVKYESDATVVLTISELISILKNVLKDSINLDLDELNIVPIAKYSNNRLHLTLDADSLFEESYYKYYCFIEDVKRVFGPFIFAVNTAVETNILINKLFSGFDHYRINNDMTIEIYY